MAKRQLRFDADEFDGTTPIAKQFDFPESSPTLVRCINELDVQTSAQVYLSDGFDEAFNYAVPAGELTMLGGTGDPTDHEGAATSNLLSEPWERIQITVVPAEAPTAGYLEVRTATDEA